MPTSDFRFDQPANVLVVTPAMYRGRARALIAEGGEWSPAMDLALIEALGRGEKLQGAADHIGVTMLDARRRFFAIQAAMTSRDYLPMDAQAVLLEELRAACVTFKSRRAQ